MSAMSPEQAFTCIEILLVIIVGCHRAALHCALHGQEQRRTNCVQSTMIDVMYATAGLDSRRAWMMLIKRHAQSHYDTRRHYSLPCVGRVRGRLPDLVKAQTRRKQSHIGQPRAGSVYV